MRNQLRMQTVDLRKFNVQKQKRGSATEYRLTAFASDFGPLRNGTWWLQQVWDDSCDLGIAIRSHHTGEVERFYVDEVTEYDEIKAWHFAPCSPYCKVRRVTVYND